LSNKDWLALLKELQQTDTHHPLKFYDRWICLLSDRRLLRSKRAEKRFMQQEFYKNLGSALVIKLLQFGSSKLSMLTKFKAEYWSALFVLKNAIKCYILRFQLRNFLFVLRSLKDFLISQTGFISGNYYWQKSHQTTMHQKGPSEISRFN